MTNEPKSGVRAGMRRRGLARFIITIVCAGLSGSIYGVAMASSAWAGGTNIASAPVVPFGQELSGNTSDARLPYSCESQIADFWQLVLTAGDRVSVNWGSTGNNVSDLDILAPGTTDATVSTRPVIYNFVIGVNGQQHSEFTAATTGTYPINFNAGCGGESTPGPYTFAVTVAHAPPPTQARASSISTAIPLTPGKMITGGNVDSEFYRLYVKAHQRIELRWDRNVDVCCMQVYLYNPGVTDATWNQNAPDFTERIAGIATSHLIATATGWWTLQVGTVNGVNIADYSLVPVLGPAPCGESAKESLAKRILGSLKCGLLNEVSAAKCGVEIAQYLTLSGKAARLVRLATTRRALQAVPEKLRPVASAIYDIYHAKFNRDAPHGLRSLAELRETFDHIQTAGQLLEFLPGLKRAIDQGSFSRVVVDLSAIAGVGDCVSGITAQVEQ